MTPLSLRQRKLLFVTGKGGVGKTTVAAGLARSLADSGRSVLLCSVDERHDLADAFGLPDVGFAPVKVDSRLSLMAMDTEASLREYLKVYLKFPVVGRISPVAAAFDFVATAAPGVREILTIGKLCYDVREGLYDCVVVDAPATGHVVGYLSAPQALGQLVRVGLIRNQTDWMLRLLSDEATTGVVVVTTAEEMPVIEATQLVAAIGAQTTTHLACVVANRIAPNIFVPRDHAIVTALEGRRVAPFDSRSLDGVFDAARLAVQRRDLADEQLEKLRAGVPGTVPIVIQPLLFDVATSSRVVAQVAASFTEELW